MTWTEERVASLSRLWAQGLSASEIAERIGGVTRNAVIGKVHRLGLKGRPSPIRTADGTAPRRRKRRTRAPAKPVAPALHAAPAVEAPAAEPLSPVFALGKTARTGRAGCAWPIGNPGEPGFHFCEEPADAGRPYCSAHCARAYIRKEKTAAA